MEADGAPFTPSLCQCSILQVFKAIATQIREKSEQTLESLRVELGTSSTESSALTNYATRLFLIRIFTIKGWYKMIVHSPVNTVKPVKQSEKSI